MLRCVASRKLNVDIGVIEAWYSTAGYFNHLVFDSVPH